MKNLELIFEKIVNIFNFLLDLIFPQTKIEKELKKMTGEIFYDKAIKNPDMNRDFYAFFSYRDILVRSAIWSLKYRRNRKIANLLAEAIFPEFLEILE